MQKCQKCENQFTWKNVEKSLALGYKPITCERCHSIHHVGFWTRLGLAVSITMLPMVLLFLRVIPMGMEYWIAFYLVWAAVVIGIAPFFARYHLRESGEDAAKEKKVQG